MTSNEIRSSFLRFFEQNGHRIVPSAPLVPGDDPTLLFTNAGMNQFKDVFLGKERRDYARATTSQKCMRVSGKHNDLENVGPSFRHHTFFEMLGNFSFGDYFKDEAISLAWRLLTEVWKLEPERLFATVFAGENGIPRDEEAYAYWRRVMPAERIHELGAADNFWAMGETGPCGRCSEVHYYRGESVPCAEPVCRGLECSCDRYVEVWNNVFMEFNRQPDGALPPLPAPSIDTGMGLERITAIKQGVLSNYDTDLFAPLFDALAQLTGRRHAGTMEPADVSMRVIADHARAATFLIADGVVPSNEWRGYVLRKIMRRAMRHGVKLGLTDPFLGKLVDVLVEQMGDAYPELKSGHAYVSKVVQSEEERFEALLVTGLPRLEELLDKSAAAKVVPGEDVFRLYDSNGLPYDFIEDTAAQREMTIDKAGFDRAMEAQKTRARAASGFGAMTVAESFDAAAATKTALEGAGDAFVGYTKDRATKVPIIALFTSDGGETPRLGTGETGYVALATTPFYIESGGQVSDVGTISGKGLSAAVEGLVRGNSRWPRLHRVQVTKGTLAPGALVTVDVDTTRRDATRRNHTATHLLHAALRKVLGSHVKQAGSLVSPEKLRFDFVHFTALTREELAEVERLVNEQVFQNTPVKTTVTSTQAAMEAGAMALFGEKYGDTVRVVSVPGFSMELCGGTHVRATGDIGPFVIAQEGGVAAGVRRIEAITGALAVAHMQAQRQSLDRILEPLNVAADQAVDVIERLQGDVKRLAKEVSQLKMKAAMGGGAAGDAGDTINIGAVKVLTRRVDDLDKNALRDLADSLKGQLGSGVVILGAVGEGRVQVVVSVTADLTAKVAAGKVVKQIAPIVGGGGGGRPDFAEAGGKNPEKLDELMEAGRKLVRQLLEG